MEAATTLSRKSCETAAPTASCNKLLQQVAAGAAAAAGTRQVATATGGSIFTLRDSEMCTSIKIRQGMPDR